MQSSCKVNHGEDSGIRDEIKRGFGPHASTLKLDQQLSGIGTGKVLHKRRSSAPR